MQKKGMETTSVEMRPPTLMRNFYSCCFPARVLLSVTSVCCFYFSCSLVKNAFIKNYFLKGNLKYSQLRVQPECGRAPRLASTTVIPSVMKDIHGDSNNNCCGCDPDV